MIGRKARKADDPGMDMSSLIDVGFLLLIYFLATSTLEPKEADLEITMPAESNTFPSPSSTVDPIEIEVSSSGYIILNDEVLENDSEQRETPLLLDRLRTYVETAKLTQSKPIVSIAADDSAKGQRFVDVLNALSHPEVAIKDVMISGFNEE